MQAVDRRTTESFFSKKVPGSSRVEGTKHTSYCVIAPGDRLILNNLTLSRGPSGEDLTIRNVKGLATDMGLTLDGFLEASSCRIRPQLVVMCIISRVLDDASTMHTLDPVAFDATLIVALGSAIDEWVGLLPRTVNKKLSAKEGKEFARCEHRLKQVAANPAMKDLAERNIARMAQLLSL